MKKLLTLLPLLLVSSIVFGQGIGTVKLMNWEAKDYKKQKQQLTVAIQRAHVKALKEAKAKKEAEKKAKPAPAKQPAQAEKLAEKKDQHLPYYYWGREGKMMLAGEMFFKKAEVKKRKKEQSKKAPAKKQPKKK